MSERRKNNFEQFVFPTSMDKYQGIKNREEFGEKIEKDFVYQGINAFNFLSKRQAQTMQLKFTCPYKQCSVKFKYSWNEHSQLFQLFYFVNKHTHSPNTKDRIRKGLKMVQLLPLDSSMQDKFKCFEIQGSGHSYNHFQYLFKNSLITPVPTDMQLYLMQLHKIGLHYVSLPNDKNIMKVKSDPEMVIITSSQMRDNFRKYGQFGYFRAFQNIFKVIKNQYKLETQQWSLFLFEGKDAANKAIPFAYAITHEDHKDDYYAFFRNYFFKAKRKNTTIISQFSEEMVKVCKQLKEEKLWDGSLLFQVTSVEDKIISNIQNLNLRENISSVLMDRNSQNTEDVILISSQIAKGCDELILKKVKQYSPYFCTSLLPPVFMGLLEHTRLKKLIDIEANNFKDHLSLPKCTSLIINTINALYQPDQEYKLNDSDLLDMKKECSQYDFYGPVLKAIEKKFKEASNLKSSKLSKNQWKIKDSNCVFQVDGRLGVFLCKCQSYNKTGIPCEHILAVCIKQSINPFPLIHKRWRKQEQ